MHCGRRNQVNPMKILLVDDDPDIAKILEMNISEVGAVLEHVSDGQAGLELALNNSYALVILDLMLPGLGGIEVCKRIREQDKTLPILMLTGKSDEIDKILGLEIGADDYLTKPFSLRELLARMKALLRRGQLSGGDPQEEREAQDLVYAELEIFPVLRLVKLHGNPVELSSTEFDLLYFLARHPGRPFTRDELAASVWEMNVSSYDSTVTAQLSRLRKKIETDPEQPRFIKTVWGVGYRFARLDELEGAE